MSGPRIVIVGGGLAAVRTAQALRDLGHSGAIVMLSAEAEAPYDRPPLSKNHLLGELPDDALRLLPESSYRDLDIELRLAGEAVALDAASHTVTLAGGETVSYDRLVLATGARARMLPVLADRPGAFPLRTAQDSRRLAPVIARRGSIVVVGGGFIGLEVAAAARTRGCSVTVVEAQQAPLIGAVGPDVATWLRARHAAHGVDVRCGTTVTEATGAPGGGEQLRLSDGSMLRADAVIVGVGVVRDVDWLAVAGLEVADGLICDVDGRTCLPEVFGAGDIVCHRTPDGPVAIGHWTAASTSARRVAHAVLGLNVPALPDDGFFWSDQYELRMQFTGQIRPDAEFALISGSFEDNKFVGHYRSAGRITGMFAVNDPRAFLKNRITLRKAAETVPVAEPVE